MTSLREEIEIFLKETYQSGNCMPREHIAATRLLHIFEKRIDSHLKMLADIAKENPELYTQTFHVITSLNLFKEEMLSKK